MAADHNATQIACGFVHMLTLDTNRPSTPTPDARSFVSRITLRLSCFFFSFYSVARHVPGRIHSQDTAALFARPSSVVKLSSSFSSSAHALCSAHGTGSGQRACPLTYASHLRGQP